MKMQFIVGAFFVALLGQGSAQDTGLNACASGCVNGVFVNAASMGCAMDDRLCVCGNTVDFTDGIRDCVNQVCGSDADTQLPIAQSFGADQCKAASSSAGLLPTATPASSSPSPAQPTQPTEQAPAGTPSTTAAATVTTPGPSPSPTLSAETASSNAVTAVAAGTTDTTASISGLIGPESSSVAASSPPSSASASASVSASSSLPSDSASATSGDADTPSGTSSAEESGNASPTPESSSQDDMTVAVRAGIGAGVGVAVVLLVILAAWLCMRKRKSKNPATQAPALQISQPLPGSGRQYADTMRQTEAGLSKTFVTSPTAHDLHQTSSLHSEPTTPHTPSAASDLDIVSNSSTPASTRPYIFD
ncbi:hypothetical protein F4820DRAFT_449904 [Hypoxylon rubiginosum]|uniref:Uncharacterized protein n=1 Tax=Hypoxylon rubiginosum TaxID=110542 RepID=A0ACB9YXA2_9PEZI|nr:hypothetical protein F4820DRAFT_449904 [Hypoxylon rubiginosum]